MRTLYFLIDDVRNIEADLIARTYEGALAVMPLIHTTVETLGIDYMLDYCGINTGLKLLNKFHREGWLPPNIQVVSSHPIGKKEIIQFLEMVGYKNDQGTFKKINERIKDGSISSESDSNN